MDTFLLDTLLRPFLAEDLEHGDITTEAIFAPSAAPTIAPMPIARLDSRSASAGSAWRRRSRRNRRKPTAYAAASNSVWSRVGDIARV